MIDWYREQSYRRIVRDPIAALKREQRESYDKTIYDVIQYYNRKNNMSAIRAAMKARFGTAIVRAADKRERPDGQVVSVHNGIEYYMRSEVSDAIDLKHIEVIDTGIGIRIVQALGNLLNQPDQYWLYTDQDDTDAEQIEDVEALMNEVREIGSYNTIATELDLLSCMVESGILHIYLRDKQLRYDVVLPCNIWLKYGRNIKYEIDIKDPKKTKETFVDYREIEDASCVIIQTASDGGDFDGSPDENQYVAYVGCCTDYPDGRYIVYHANDPWPLPDVGDKNAIEYEHKVGSEVANPLTWMRHHGTPDQQAVVTTEYPIVLWRGGHQMISDDRIPITTSLYEDSVELEIGWSRLARAALCGARGRDLIRVGDMLKLPQSLDQPVIDKEGDLIPIGWPASHAKDGASVFQIITEQVAGGFNVPGYMVLGQLSGMNPASGVALAIQSAPLIAFRNRRHKLNRDAMRRMFDIERAMLVMEHPEAQKLLGPNIRQKWDPGTWKPPVAEIEEMQAINLDLDTGTTDIVAAVKRRHRLATDQEAEALIALWRERDPQYQFGKAPEPTVPTIGEKPAPFDKEDEGEDGED
jgi:hypothetical protein